MALAWQRSTNSKQLDSSKCRISRKCRLTFSVTRALSDNAEPHKGRRILQGWKDKAIVHLKKTGRWPLPNKSSSEEVESQTRPSPPPQEPSAVAPVASLPPDDANPAHKIPPFSSFEDRAGYNGYLLSSTLVDEVACETWKHDEPFYRRWVLNEGGRILGLDSTYKIASRLFCHDPQSGIRDQPFESFASVLNEYGQVLWYGFQLEHESLRQIEKHLCDLRDRLKEQYGPAFEPGAIYVDNCCNSEVRPSLQNIWPGTPVLLDLYHWFDRWDEAIGMPNGDVRRCVFRAELKDACLVPDARDYRETKTRLTRQRGSKPSHREILTFCRRSIPPPFTLRRNIEMVLKKWSERDSRRLWEIAAQHLEVARNAKGSDAGRRSGEKPLFFKPNFASVKRRQMGHVCRRIQSLGLDHECDETCTACLSDPSGINLNFERPGSTPGKPKMYFTGRGTSQNENFHSLLRRSVLARMAGALRVAALVGTFIFHWNVDRGIEKRGEKNYYTHHFGLLFLINSLFATCVENANELPFPELEARMRDHPRAQLGIECVGLVGSDSRDDEEEEEKEASSKKTRLVGNNAA